MPELHQQLLKAGSRKETKVSASASKKRDDQWSLTILTLPLSGPHKYFKTIVKTSY